MGVWGNVASSACGACGKLLPPLSDAANAFMALPDEVDDIQNELESIQAIINIADKMAAAEQEEIRTRVRQLRRDVFHVENIIGNYEISEEQHHCASYCIRTQYLRLRIAYALQGIKSRAHALEKIQCSSEQGPTSSTRRSENFKNSTSLRKDPCYVEEAEVVGFEAPTQELLSLLEETRPERTVICVLGMGGQGKTTLAKIVFDKVIKKFDCCAWIKVPRDYTVEGLLKEMLKMFRRGRTEADSKVSQESLADQVKNYLRESRYVILFDDVWEKMFWPEINFALLDNGKRSRVLITTRSREVAEFCKQSFVHIQNLQSLTPENSMQLFCIKAFLNQPNGRCPVNLLDICSDIVDKCKGLPLAIIATGFVLARIENKRFKWQKFSQNLFSELKDSYITEMTDIIGLSYDDLPYHLKSCFMYFGIYPKGYEIESTRLIRQWIAEGFVKSEGNKTLEEVAEEYLEELIKRSLVEVSSIGIDGKAKRCRVHDLLHLMILKKIEDLNFCKLVIKDYRSTTSGVIRRLQIATASGSNNLMVNIESSHIWSLYISGGVELPEDFVKIIPTKYRKLKVLDIEDAQLNYVLENVGNFFTLKYLSFRKTNVKCLPQSIGDLQFLETLDLRQTQVRQMPREINKLTKLRHLLANHTFWGSDYGMQMMEGIGGMLSLQTLRQVEIDHRGLELIEELERLTQLRLLGLIHVKQEYQNALCSSINKMHDLEKLSIDASPNEVIDLCSISPLPALKKLRLGGKLESLPEWIPKLNDIVKLSVISSNLTNDSLKSVMDMPCLLSLSLNSAYEGEGLCFEDGGFQKLEKLSLIHLQSLKSIIVSERALPSLKEFKLEDIPRLKKVPSGICHLGNLEVLKIINMPEEFTDGIGKEDWIHQHVSQVIITRFARGTRLPML